MAPKLTRMFKLLLSDDELARWREQAQTDGHWSLAAWIRFQCGKAVQR